MSSFFLSIDEEGAGRKETAKTICSRYENVFHLLRGENARNFPRSDLCPYREEIPSPAGSPVEEREDNAEVYCTCAITSTYCFVRVLTANKYVTANDRMMSEAYSKS
jgi:hypothetical protein